MRSARVERDRINVHETAAPARTAGVALIRVRRVLLGSEDHLDFHRRRGFSGIPGRWFAGVVEDAGGGPVAAGTRVLADPELPCGECPSCLAGLGTGCPHRSVAGVDALDGALAEVIAVAPSRLVAIPEAVDDDHACFAAPLGRGILLGRRLGLAESSLITVIGHGVAALCASLALRLRHPRTRLLSDDPATTAAAAQLGLPHRPVGDAGRRHDQDAVVDASVSAASLEASVGMIRPRGQIALAAEAWDAVPAAVLRAIAALELSVLGAPAGRSSDGLELLRRRSVDPLAAIVRRVGLEEAVSWMAAASPQDLDGTLATFATEAKIRVGGS